MAKTKSVGRSEILSNMEKKLGLPRHTNEIILDALIQEITTALVEGNNVIFKNFMTLKVVEKGARRGRNPKTGEIELFPPVKTVKCDMCKAIKDAINAPKEEEGEEQDEEV